MGNYIYPEELGEIKLKLINRKMIKWFRKRLDLNKIINTMKIYVDTHAPAVNLAENQFDDVFCTMLNNTTPFFDLL